MSQCTEPNVEPTFGKPPFEAVTISKAITSFINNNFKHYTVSIHLHFTTCHFSVWRREPYLRALSGSRQTSFNVKIMVSCNMKERNPGKSSVFLVHRYCFRSVRTIHIGVSTLLHILASLFAKVRLVNCL